MENHYCSCELTERYRGAQLACNCLTYLQDMDGEHGAFRCVPGSHLDYSRQVKQPRSSALIAPRP